MSVGLQSMLIGAGLIVTAILTRLPSQFCFGGETPVAQAITWTLTGTVGGAGVIAFVSGAVMKLTGMLGLRR
jgi:hypothetical protein